LWPPNYRSVPSNPATQKQPPKRAGVDLYYKCLFSLQAIVRQNAVTDCLMNCHEYFDTVYFLLMLTSQTLRIKLNCASPTAITVRLHHSVLSIARCCPTALIHRHANCIADSGFYL